MEGWTEEEIRDKNLMAPCGLYCGACGVYIATRDKNEKFKTVMGNLYGTKPEETQCLGCMQPDPPKKIYGYCTMCTIRDCVKSKGFYSCHQCTDWPCTKISGFGLETGKRVMMKTIPIWREKSCPVWRRGRQCGMGPFGLRALPLPGVRQAPLQGGAALP